MYCTRQQSRIPPSGQIVLLQAAAFKSFITVIENKRSLTSNGVREKKLDFDLTAFKDLLIFFCKNLFPD